MTTRHVAPPAGRPGPTGGVRNTDVHVSARFSPSRHSDAKPTMRTTGGARRLVQPAIVLGYRDHPRGNAALEHLTVFDETATDPTTSTNR